MESYTTAAELMASLEDDSNFKAKITERDTRIALERQILAKEEKPLLAELRTVGIVVNSVWDLVNVNSSYPQAIPVLLDRLAGQASPKLREGLIRALSVREARTVAGPSLLALFISTKHSDSELRWLVANALSIASTPEMRDELKALELEERDAAVKERLACALKQLPLQPQ